MLSQDLHIPKTDPNDSFVGALFPTPSSYSSLKKQCLQLAQGEGPVNPS